MDSENEGKLIKKQSLIELEKSSGRTSKKIPVPVWQK